MKIRRLIATLLIVGGALGIVFGKLTYTTKTHEAKLGDLEFEVREKKTVDFPIWAGAGTILLGAALLAWTGGSDPEHPGLFAFRRPRRFRRRPRHLGGSV